MHTHVVEWPQMRKVASGFQISKKLHVLAKEKKLFIQNVH